MRAVKYSHAAPTIMSLVEYHSIDLNLERKQTEQMNHEHGFRQIQLTRSVRLD